MDEVRMQAAMQMMSAQRNQALDTVCDMAGEITALSNRVRELESEVAELKKEKEQPNDGLL